MSGNFGGMMGKQILLVEDDVAIMETLALFLRYEGYEVLKARNTEEAAACIHSSQPDLVLLDYMLQDDTAEPIVKILRAQYGESVKVILLTAADDPAGKGQAVSADAVVAKPFELDFLLETIRTCIEQGRESRMLYAQNSTERSYSQPALL